MSIGPTVHGEIETRTQTVHQPACNTKTYSTSYVRADRCDVWAETKIHQLQSINILHLLAEQSGVHFTNVVKSS